MKIAYIGQKGLPARGGGVERHVEELAQLVAQSGHEVFAYSRSKYTKSEVSEYKGINILYTPAIYTKHFEAITHTIFSVFDAMKRNFDIIHFHSIGPSLVIPLARLLNPQVKIVATVHSPDYYHQKWNWFAKIMLRFGEFLASKFAHQVITVSKTQKHYLWQAYQLNANYIPNGVHLPSSTSNTSLLMQWGLEPNEYIISVNRLIRHKGLHYLIEAYKQLDTDKKLVIVGGAEYTDDYVKELHELAEDNQNIIFTGKQSGQELHALFSNAYLYVHPSLSEGLSISLLEALSYGHTVIASDIPENMEVIEDIGLSFTRGNVEDLSTTLSFALNHPRIVDQYRNAGKEKIKNEYSWEKIAKQTLEVYDKSLATAAQKKLKLAEVS